MNQITQQSLPFFEHLKKFVGEGTLGLHMPGHNHGCGFPSQIKDSLIDIDTTELDATDNLNSPGPSLQAAQKLAADFWGASHTFFVTTGSTTAIKAAILVLTKGIKKIFLPRCVHQSVLHAMALLAVKPIFLPIVDDSYTPTSPFGLPDLSKWQEIFLKYVEMFPGGNLPPLFITAPDYYGNLFSLPQAIRLAHKFSIPVIVDQAHGAHLRCLVGSSCREANEADALNNGAALVIQSAHKTLPALTPGAYLHLGHMSDSPNEQTELINQLQIALQIMQTSSPSFVIGAGLDYARYFAANKGAQHFTELTAKLQQIKEKILSLGFAHVKTDCTRLVIDTLPISPAKQAAKFLSEQGIDCEMADWRRLVLLFPIGLPENWPDILLAALKKLKNCSANLWHESKFINDIELAKADKAYFRLLSQTYSAPAETILNSRTPLLSDLLSGNTIIPYPPGVPLFWQGMGSDIMPDFADKWKALAPFFDFS